MKLPRVFTKLINPREVGLIRKDFREIWSNGVVRTLLILLPVVLAGVVPIVFMVLASVLPEESVESMRQMRALLGDSQSYMDDRQSMFYIFSDCLGPMLFLLIPLLVSCLTAATSFVGERQHGTLETLFLTPMSTREIFKAKAVGSMVLSVIATLASFVIYLVVMIVGDVLLQVTFFLANPSWLVIVLLVSPALIVFGVLFMVILNAHGTSVGESLQICGYVTLPFILLFVAQFSGVFRFHIGWYLLLALVIWVVDLVLWRNTSRHFTTEKLLR